jgi:hypothetical protein
MEITKMEYSSVIEGGIGVNNFEVHYQDCCCIPQLAFEFH